MLCPSLEVKTRLGHAAWDWSTGESPLHYAVMCGRDDAVRRLVGAGADVDATADNIPGFAGETPLHGAVQADKGDMVSTEGR